MKKLGILILIGVVIVEVTAGCYFWYINTLQVTPNESATVNSINLRVGTKGEDVPYTKDDQHVYFWNKVIEGADPATFKLIGVGFGKDKSAVYLINKRFEVSDVDTFESVHSQTKTFDLALYRDSSSVYKWILNTDRPGVNLLIRLPDVDPKTLVILGNTYFKDSNNVYYCRKTPDKNNFELHKIPDANPNTFKKISDNYSRDDKHIFYHNYIVDGADPNSFQLINNGMYGGISGKDNSHVFFEDRMQPQVDVATFKNVGSLWQDVNGKYYLDEEGGATLVKLDFDPVTAKKVGGKYIVADNSVYYSDYYLFKKLNGSDPATFKVLGECASGEMSWAEYAVDKNRVYAGSEIVSGADPATFQIIGTYSEKDGMPGTSTYSKDKNTVYSNCGSVITGADSKTFEYIGDGKAQDKYRIYIIGEFETTQSH